MFNEKMQCMKVVNGFSVEDRLPNPSKKRQLLKSKFLYLTEEDFMKRNVDEVDNFALEETVNDEKGYEIDINLSYFVLDL